MSYRVIVQPQARDDIDQVLMYLVRHASPDVAARWLAEVEGALDTLERMPLRCPLAPENGHFKEDIRQLLVSPYRILFAVLADEVRILHVRHSSRRALSE